MAIQFQEPIHGGTTFGQGLEHGRSLFAGMINPALQSAQLQQQYARHLQDLEQKKLEEENLMQRHMQDLALRQMVEQRLQSLVPYQIGQYENTAALNSFKQQTEQAKADAYRLQGDPAAQVDLFQQLMNMEGANNPAQPDLHNDITNMVSQGLGQPAKPPEAAPTLSPAAIAAFEKATKTKLPKNMGGTKETPDERRAKELELYRKKKEIEVETARKKLETGGALTTPMKTSLQKQISSSDKVLPLLDKYLSIDIPGYAAGYVKPGSKAFAEMISAVSTEDMMSASNMPKTQGSVDLLHDIFTPRPGESEDSIKRRVQYLKDMVVHNRNENASMLEKNSINLAPIAGHNSTAKKYQVMNNETNQIEYLTEAEAKEAGVI